MESASIRYNNPGAMWDGKISRKWGSTGRVILKDGQDNHIAMFPSTVDGAAAQFDLWKTNYSGMTLKDAIKKWSGGNSSPAYAKFLKDAGIPSTTVINSAFLASPKGITLMKAQAQWEAGKVYPMSDADWAKAQAMVFNGVPKGGATIFAVVAGGGATVAASQHVTWLQSHWMPVVAGIVGVAIVIDLILYFKGK